MIRFSSAKICSLQFHPISRLSKRTFLSEAFDCKEVWNERLNSPIFQKVPLETMYYDLSRQYKKTHKISPLDLDIFVNAHADTTYITEVEELVHQFRLTIDTHKTFPTTHHAVIRLFLLANKEEDLLRILNDRLNYGIFPDDYCMIYLLNKFLKAKDYRKAAKIAVLSMFQEDFSNEWVKFMSLFAVHKYVQSVEPEPWDLKSAEEVVEKKEEEEEGEEEMEKVKIPYLRNKYFDDHFDLVDGKRICGKTLAMIGAGMEDALGCSYQLMGLALYQKWKKLEEYLGKLLKMDDKDGRAVVYEESVAFAKEKCAGKSELLEKLEELVQKNNIVKGSLLDVVEKNILKMVMELGPKEIENQIKVFRDWNVMREEKLKQHLEELNKMKRLLEVDRVKKEMAEKEEQLYYFENEDKIELVVEQKEAILNKRARWEQNQVKSEEEYIPPEVKKRGATHGHPKQ